MNDECFSSFGGQGGFNEKILGWTYINTASATGCSVTNESEYTDCGLYIYNVLFTSSV